MEHTKIVKGAGGAVLRRSGQILERRTDFGRLADFHGRAGKGKETLLTALRTGLYDCCAIR
ncbi:hypothetical protein NECAME_17139 [Necator americanus]|uniref:Uncharacterized protein n=1 Tax=Necator americanus TaxID=51031 RepID=W2TRQ4_NECAM|nr:hypothetical protein NECAME_17139 [Necator americanus]ETN84493.1 hypothetical protein NECAME_17139 [Necator americanus]